MFVAILIFIFLLPVAIYYFYARPKHIDLLHVTFTLIFCNVLTQLFLLIPSNQRNIPLPQNIDYSPTASISKNSQAKNSFFSSSGKTKKEISDFYKNNLKANTSSNTDIVCSDCSNNVWGNDPDFSNQPEPTNFIWPLKGKIIESFYISGDDINEGINIAVPVGTNVRAIDDGIVSYADEEIKGYGKMIIIRHENGYISAYAHNSELKVSRGYRVLLGQVIAKSGQTGSVQSPQLHFELRKGVVPLNPIKFLPNNGKVIGRN